MRDAAAVSVVEFVETAPQGPAVQRAPDRVCRIFGPKLHVEEPFTWRLHFEAILKGSYET
jgi:hypothetical protein